MSNSVVPKPVEISVIIYEVEISRLAVVVSMIVVLCWVVVNVVVVSVVEVVGSAVVVLIVVVLGIQATNSFTQSSNGISEHTSILLLQGTSSSGVSIL